jgi:threonylcarbamoyladenosine tRNA methylthiotransferase MtaB
MTHINNFMPHLHIPLQSGDNDILKRMNRRYTREQFKEVVDTCRAAVPDAAIGLDVMVGFPGETEAMFEQSRELIEATDCTYLHVFPYSKRPGTRAAEFGDQVSADVKQRRAGILRTLGRDKSRAFYRRYIDSKRVALLETENLSGNTLKGYTDNYIPVVTKLPDILPTAPVIVELIELSGDSVEARLE